MSDENKKKEEEKKKANTEPPPTEGPIRPGDGDIFVFLVGINDYINASPLFGCIKDLDLIEGFLKDRFEIKEEHELEEGVFTRSYPIEEDGYQRLRICRLENVNATYSNILTQFQVFFQEVNVTDKVWFHFSGHGVQAPTATVFANLEQGMDQCLMCHDFEENIETGIYTNLLADKEVAALLAQLASGEGGSPHIVVTYDCCHSGGGTRDGGVRFRGEELQSENSKNRELATYFGDYAAQLEADANLEMPHIPHSPHISLTACTREQLAGETKDGGGFFTETIIDLLERFDGRINYSDLKLQAAAAIRQHTEKQTPQLEALGGVKAYNRFLEGMPEGHGERFEVRFQEGDWTIACGRMQGMLSTEVLEAASLFRGESVTIDIYPFDKHQMAMPVARAEFIEVGPSLSTIEIVEGELDDETTHYGLLSYLPAKPEFVFISGSSTKVEGFVQNWEESISIGKKNIFHLTESNNAKPHDLEVRFLEEDEKDEQGEVQKEAGIWIHDFQTGKEIGPYSFNREDNVLFDLIKIVNWRRLIALENEDSELSKQIELQVDFKGRRNKSLREEAFKGKEQVVEATRATALRKNSPKDRLYFLLPELKLLQKDRKLHFYLLNLFSNYEVRAIDGEKKFTPRVTADEEVMMDETAETIAYTLNKKRFWGLGPKEEEDVMYYKVLVTEEELDYQQFVQDGVNTTRGIPEDELSFGLEFKDWCTLTMKLTMKRNS